MNFFCVQGDFSEEAGSNGLSLNDFILTFPFFLQRVPRRFSAIA